MAYQDPKEFKGRSYRGMKVGGAHLWSYPDGSWTERKVAPDEWQVSYTSLKRRRRRAPQGSGAEAGSGYHWFIVAHQWAYKLDANTYATHMEGTKRLIAFRKPGWSGWNTQFRNAKRRARERTIAALEEALARLKAEETMDVEDPLDAAPLQRLAAAAAVQQEEAPVGRPGERRKPTTRPKRRRAAVRRTKEPGKAEGVFLREQ